MKKINFKLAILFFLFFALFFILHINLSFVSRSRSISLTHPSISGKEHLQVKKVFRKNPLPPPPPPSFIESSQAAKINCDRSHKSYDLCKINGPTVLDPTTATFYLVEPKSPTPSQSYTVEKIRPYPRKWENFTMKKIKELTLTSGPLSSPSCEIQHNVPALVFSAGGYTGNFFHDFNDGLIPLFITVNSVLPDDQDFILVISKARDWWVNKYVALLKAFSKHPIINLDNDTSTHCFTSATIGLISHGFVTINPKLLPNSKSFTHFRALLDKAYSHGQNNIPKFNSSKYKSRMVLASRTGNVGRVILNQNDVKLIAEKVGFDVTIFEPTHRTPLSKVYKLINSSHAMIGVHGAALTHSLFLRPGAVFLQVVPIGNEWVAEYCFGKLGKAMGLEYMEYRIGVEESSLIDKYSNNSLLIRDPIASRGKNWSNDIMSIYLKEQNVRLDLIRFRKYLEKAYKKAKKFMDKEG